jgi:cytochrome c-type biogenesis protein CcmH
MELIIIIVAFLLLLLAIVWGHFLKQVQGQTIVADSERDETNVRLYHEHKAEIEKDFKQNNIDEESYQYLLSELDNTLLQDMQQAVVDDSKEQQVKDLSILWPSGISVFILVFSFALYSNIGGYEQLSKVPLASVENNTESAEQQAIAQIKELMAITQNEPENSDAWFSLGQTLVSVGDFDSAMKAYDQVLAIEGEKADVYGAKAQATYYKNEQVINNVVQGFIDKALTIDPSDPSTNILLGMHNFIGENYQAAIKHWQLVIESDKKSVNKQALIEAVTEAENRLSQSNNKANVAETTTGPQLKITVELSEEILAKVIQGQDKVVFIYAIPADEKRGRMPVAAIKMNASDLPTTVILNDSRAMTPQAKLSDVENVHIYAIVSADGGAGIKSGDYKAELKNITVSTTDEIRLVVNSVVP